MTELPIRIISVANRREHWRKRAERAAAHKRASFMVPKHPLPCVVKLTRIAPKAGGTLDGDNLQSAFKALRDGIAARLGVDDADPRVTWEYAQALGKTYAARVEIFPVDPVSALRRAGL